MPFFVRIPGESTELLAVDRKNEYFNAQAAAESGVGPQDPLLPSRTTCHGAGVPGGRRPCRMRNSTEPGMPTRIAQVIKRLHAGTRFLTDFNMFRLTEYYLQDLQGARRAAFPMATRSACRRCAAHRAGHGPSSPLATVPCHNDLLAENYMQVDGELRLIDYEYSGNNDPCFELGNTCQELQYDEAQQEQVCAAYFGSASDAMLARMKLNMIMSDVGWGLWAAIQARISKIDYDFWGWATERWGRAVQKMDSAGFRAVAESRCRTRGRVARATG